MNNNASMTRRALTRLALAGATTALLGCAGPQLADLAQQTPVLDFQQYFNGTILAHGMVSDRGGRITRRFTVRMDCSWANEVGTLDEHFAYDDGEKQRRVWTVRKLPDGTYVGTADDVVGQALGAAAGPAFNWRYTLQLPWRGNTLEVQFDDWMVLIDAKTVINRASISKFGVHLGDVTLSFQRP